MPAFGRDSEVLAWNTEEGITMSNDEVIRPEAEESELNSGPLNRLKKYSGRLMVTTLLSTTLLLSACTDSASDCIPSTPPPVTPGSSGFTAAKPATPGSGTYCRSRSTGGFYYGGYYGSSGGSSVS